MSVLMGDGLIRSGAPGRTASRKDAGGKAAEPGGLTQPARRTRRAAGETRRPPTRARVVAGHRRPAMAQCESRLKAPRWPWLVVVAGFAGLIVTGLGLLANGIAAAPVPEQTVTVSVAPGDTLTALALRFAPESEPGAVVARIEQLNDLRGAEIVPGLPLTVPVSPAVAGVGR